MGSLGDWNMSAVTDTASDWADSAGSWAGGVSEQAGETARDWLDSTTVSPEQQSKCLSVIGEAMKEMFKCTARYPNQFDTQAQERCFCWFDMHHAVETAHCQSFQHNQTTGVTQVSGVNGQITYGIDPNMKTECEPYYAAWLEQHPEPSIFQLLLDRINDFMKQHPEIVLIVVMLLCLLGVFVLFQCLRKSSWGRSVAASFDETWTQLGESCSNEYAECVDDHPECCKTEGQVASSREVFALRDPEEQPLALPSGAREIPLRDVSESRALTSSKAQRSLKVYPDDSELEEDAEPQGLGAVFSSLASLFHPAEEEPETEEVHYEMVQEGPTLAELRRERQAQAGGTTQPMHSAPAAPAAASGPSAEYYAPPYHNVHRMAPDGHHMVHANPEVLQQAAARTTGQVLPARPQNVSVPFPHERVYGAPPLQGRPQGGRQDLLV